MPVNGCSRIALRLRIAFIFWMAFESFLDPARSIWIEEAVDPSWTVTAIFVSGDMLDDRRSRVATAF